MQLKTSFLWILTAVTLSTRFYNLAIPDYVCWDETHFGKMASHYINQTYFMDVHPPLGKMLIALVARISGADGTFKFSNPGDPYLNTNKNFTQYYEMRAFSAVLGSLIIPLSYETVRLITSSKEAALLTAVLLIFDPGLISLSQYILLDPILMFFMTATIFFTVKFLSLNQLKNIKTSSKKNAMYTKMRLHCFSKSWWFHLFMSGLCLGCMMSVKWIGFFTVCFIGLWTIMELWELLGDVKGISLRSFVMHFLARAICLIIVPLCVYVASFALHYHILENSGTGAGFHSSVFQSCLKGSELYNSSMPLYIAFGSIVTLKHHHYSFGGYLHSHYDRYPVEIMPLENQQVTLYYYKDQNNLWEMLKPSAEEIKFASKKLLIPVNSLNYKDRSVPYLRNGDILRLRHVLTGHFLHIHPRSAPLTPRQQIVSGQSDLPGEDKLDELWRMEVIHEQQKENAENISHIQILSTVVRFVHVRTGCLLHTTSKTLPKWGSQQAEITCSHHRKDRSSARWNFEYNSHEKLEKTKLETCHMTFFEKFRESHLVMATSNAALKPQEGEHSSRPWHWPLDYKGQAFSRMDETDVRVYLLGNPLIFWVNLLVIALYPFLSIAVHAMKLRGYAPPDVFSALEKDHSGSSPIAVLRESLLIYNAKKKARRQTVSMISRNMRACGWFYTGWAFHYFPFLFMSRILYFHHYYPAFIFSCCLTGCTLDLLFKSSATLFGRFVKRQNVPKYFNRCIMALFIVGILQSFYLYSPLCYGMTGPHAHKAESSMYGLKLFKLWDI